MPSPPAARARRRRARPPDGPSQNGRTASGYRRRGSMPAVTSYEVRLASRPQGWPTPDNFSLVRVDVPPPADGEVLVRNRFMSVAPYMRGRMNDVRSYTPPFQIGQPLEGHAGGDVVESRDAAFRAGDIVTSMRGWREHFV